MVIIFGGQTAWGQPKPLERDYSWHHQLWSSLTLEKKISSKVNADLDIQHRRQSISAENLNIFRAYQYQSYRLWVHYNFNERLRFSLSPAMYVHEVPLSDDGWQFLREPQKEIRPSAALWYMNEHSSVHTSQRYAIEYRYRTSFQNKGFYWPEWRLRYMILLSKDLGENIDVIIQNELFIAFGKFIQYNIFDQNRILAGMEFYGSDKIKIRTGYMFIIDMQRSGKSMNLINILVLGMNLTL